MQHFDILPAIFSFLFVIGLLLATLWFLKSRNLGNLKFSGKSIELMETVRLDPKHKLVVLRYMNRTLLLAVSPNQVTLLDSQPKEDLPEIASGPPDQSKKFKDQLHGLLNKGSRK